MLKGIRSYSWAAAAVLVGLLLTGCFREVVRDPQSLVNANDVDIVVVTSDGFRYAFDDGEYVVTTDTLGLGKITGKGKRYQPHSSQFSKFEGSIPFSAIEKTTESEVTPWLFITIGTIVLFVGFGLYTLPRGKIA